ncbi:MAG: hypothetical protein WBB98_13385 [Xanthobacteraceae bacterium]
MKQSRLMSMLESIINVVVGFGISLVAQIVFLPMLGVTISLHQNLKFAVIMTVISIARSFILRRVFEAMRIRRPLSPFMQAVIAERFRQIEQEGWSLDHDDQHAHGELATAGAAYAKAAGEHLTDGFDVQRDPKFYQPSFWPWNDQWWKPTGFRRDLVKACALIVADGEKFDRSRGRKARAV